MTKSHSDNIDVLLNSSLPSLKKLEGERELILQYSREIINICSKTIESSHTGDKEKAINYLNQAKIMLKKAKDISNDVEGSYLTGNILLQSEQEYVEAVLTYSYVFDKDINSFLQDLNITSAAIITGILDFSGEIRRLLLNALMEEDYDRALECLNTMRYIYGKMVAIDIRTSLIQGFKKKLDQLRIQIERSIEQLHLSFETNKLTDLIQKNYK